MKILSVDDSAVMRKLIKNTVDVMGFDFLEASNGQEALEVLAMLPGEVDLILLDWNMPVMDGMQTLKALKANEVLKKIPVTMVTTEIERSKVVAALAAGARNYVMKPFTQEMLVNKIMDSLGMGI
jgi:two-component system, chemotaxis family, chemotaxis protein CheY